MSVIRYNIYPTYPTDMKPGVVNAWNAIRVSSPSLPLFDSLTPTSLPSRLLTRLALPHLLPAENHSPSSLKLNGNPIPSVMHFFPRTQTNSCNAFAHLHLNL